MPENNSLVAWFLLLLLALIWGSSFILIKIGLTVLSPGEVGAIRIISAGLFLLPISFSRWKNLKRKHLVLLFTIGLVGSFIPAFLFAKAQTQINSSLAGILNALTPIFTMLIGVLLFKRAFSPRVILGIIAGLAGVVMLVTTGENGFSTGFSFYVFYVVLATICYGLNLNIIKYMIPELKAATITSISLTFVLPFGLIYLLLGTPFITRFEVPDAIIWPLSAIVLLGIMGTAIALLLFNRLVKITTPVFTSSVTYLIPVVAIFWGVIDGEQLYVTHIIAMAIIILGVYQVNQAGKKNSIEK